MADGTHQASAHSTLTYKHLSHLDTRPFFFKFILL